MFESDKILYVKMTEQYIDYYIRMYTDSKIQKSLFKKEYNHDTIVNWIKKEISEKEKYKFSMLEKETKEFIGNIEIIKKGEVGEIMISITSNKQGMHYSEEAIKSIIEYGRKNLGISKYDLNVYKNNDKAIHIYEKVGFIKDDESISEDSIHMKL